ncbi:MAG: phospholipase D-like domain-containing protein [Candidatus Omnitrophica bacterium]|nr:phospholipase D-like domain-containing protein [Candidatus Omnitrophota bacterium]
MRQPKKLNTLKIILPAFLICISTLFLPINAFADMLFGKDYYQTLHKYLTQSKSTITIAMYFIIIDPKDLANPVNGLVNDLIVAKSRGVAIKVILEDSKLKENRLAYELLRANNIAVYFDTPEHLLHVKEVIIDDRYLFVGSANWSKAAIDSNYEATIFEDSSPDALIATQQINNIPIQKKDIFLAQAEGVAISSDFLLAPNSGRRLIKDEASKQFDLYLLLCKLQQKASKPSLDIDYDSLAKNLGYTAPNNLGLYRNAHHYFYDRIRHSLKHLQAYGLIDYRKEEVTLKADNSKKPNAPAIIIPFEYWDYGYSNSLSTRAKYMYLICLYEASRSTRYPFWFRSQEDMSKLYGISDTTISLGLLELEAKGMIEITRDKPTPPDFSSRQANIYRMLSLTPQ